MFRLPHFALPALALSLLLPACSLVVGDEVNDLRPDGNAKRDVTIRLRDWDAHVGQPTFMRFVTDGSNQVNAHAVIDPSPSACFDVRLNRGAVFSASRVDFYADLNLNGVIDPPGATGDHSWIRQLDDTGELLFIHDTMFDDLTVEPSVFALSAVQLQLTGLEEFEGASITTLVVGQDLVDVEQNIRRRTVRGMYVTPVAGGMISFELPGVADPGVSYDLELTIGDHVQSCTIAGLRTPTMNGDPLVVDTSLGAIECEASSPPDCSGFDDACEAGDEAACASLFERCAFVDCGR